MRASSRMRRITLGTLAVAGVLGAAWSARSTTTPRPAAPTRQLGTAQFGGGMMSMGGFSPEQTKPVEPAERVVYVRERLSARALAIHAKLSQPLDMPFPADTPLEDVLKYIQQSTNSPDLEGGIPFYLDPAGLTEAEKTPASPVSLNLKGIPAAKTLRLMLAQLQLAYAVDEDGFVHITAADSPDVPADPSRAILEELAQLRREIAELKAMQSAGMRGAMGGRMQ